MSQSQSRHLKVRLELIWWLFTAVLVLAVLSPLLINQVVLPFLWVNVLFVVIFVTFTRYIFLLRHTLWARKMWPKFLVIAVSVVLFFVIVTALGDFNNFVEEVGLQTLVDHLPASRQYNLIRYIQSEAIFFGVGSAIVTVIFPLRMLISIWRTRNTPDRV
ncbi:MAG: hypothetical protein R3301_17415 [Saprospiraceae bacterium]|nr:hypothetical protein [Saprospiraceae bacterium]